MVDLQSREYTVDILTEEERSGVPVEDLLDAVQRAVRRTRSRHPDLTDFHLHDVRLRVYTGKLVAVLEFRPLKLGIS